MPELPEVEVIRRGLSAKLPGRRVEAVEGRDARVLLAPLDELSTRLSGQRVSRVERRGKYLIVRFERDALLIHLGMTGQLTFWDKERPDSAGFLRHPKTGLQVVRQHPVDQHTHLVLRFADGNGLFYRDIRKFGKIRLFDDGDWAGSDVLATLGPEPLGDAFDLDAFEARLRRTRRAIKAVLLDQRVVAGVGNIYADEALFEARIRPTWKAHGLSRAERFRLHAAIPSVLAKGIRHRGTSFKDYVDSDGLRGGNQERLCVYGRSGEPCRECGTPIRKIVLAQRGTHFCPTCQRRSRAR